MNALELIHQVMSMRDELRTQIFDADYRPNGDYADGWDDALGEALIAIEELLIPYSRRLKPSICDLPVVKESLTAAKPSEDSQLTIKPVTHLAHFAEGQLNDTPAAVSVRGCNARVHLEFGSQNLFLTAGGARCLGHHLLLAADTLDALGGKA